MQLRCCMSGSLCLTNIPRAGSMDLQLMLFVMWPWVPIHSPFWTMSMSAHAELPHGIHRRLCSLRCATGVVICVASCRDHQSMDPWICHHGVMILGSWSGDLSGPSSSWCTGPRAVQQHWSSLCACVVLSPATDTVYHECRCEGYEHVLCLSCSAEHDHDPEHIHLLVWIHTLGS